MHFTSFFNFKTKGDDFKNKEQINGVKVRVGIWYGVWVHVNTNLI